MCLVYTGLEASAAKSDLYCTVVCLGPRSQELPEEKFYTGLVKGSAEREAKWDEVTCFGQKERLSEVTAVVIKVKQRGTLRAKNLGEVSPSARKVSHSESAQKIVWQKDRN